MQATPRTVSHVLVSFMERNRLSQFSIKVFPDARIPNMSLTCDVTMIRAAADVNPEETGPDMKSITNPVNITKEILFSSEMCGTYILKKNLLIDILLIKK